VSAVRSHSWASVRSEREAAPGADSRSNWAPCHGLSTSQTTRATWLPGAASSRNASEGGGAAKVVFGRGQDAALRIVGIGGEEESAAGGADDADAAAAAIEGIAGHRLVEVTDGDDGGAGAFGQTLQRMEGLAHGLVRIDIVPR
jgi:hypothetical protein